jgi:hypothetical protein
MVAVLGFGLSSSDSVWSLIRTKGIRPGEAPSSRGVRPDRPHGRKESPQSVRFLGASSKALSITLADGEDDSVILSVEYDCPFETGELTPFFVRDHMRQDADITCKPRSSRVSVGQGKATFHVTGRDGRTDWLLVRLKSTGPKCRQVEGNIPRGFFSVSEIGEYMVDGCVLWRIQKYQKVWPSGA